MNRMGGNMIDFAIKKQRLLGAQNLKDVGVNEVILGLKSKPNALSVIINPNSKEKAKYLSGRIKGRCKIASKESDIASDIVRRNRSPSKLLSKFGLKKVKHHCISWIKQQGELSIQLDARMRRVSFVLLSKDIQQAYLKGRRMGRISNQPRAEMPF